MTPRVAPTRGRYRRVRLVVAPPQPGKGGLAETFVDQVRSIKGSDPLKPIVVLVGSNVLKLYLQRLLAIRLSGHANVSFLLLKDHARALGTAPMVDKGRRQIPEFGRELLLAEAIKVRSKGSYFERIAGKEGFIEALGATIRDLKDAGVEPATLRAAARARRNGAPPGSAGAISAGKLDDLADMYETYDDLLRDRRFYDDEDLMRAAIAEASSATGPAVIVFGFYDATWQQRRLIYETLAFRQGVVLFPWGAEADDPSFDYARPMLDWFRSFIMERADLSGAGAGRAPQEVCLLSAPGEAREAVEAVRWLVSRAREGSVPFGEMALLYRNGEPYRRALTDILAAAGGVPHYMADGTPVASTVGARALLLLLQAREDGLARRTVIDVFSLVMKDSQTALWDRLSREAGVVKGIDEWSLRLARLEALRLHQSRGDGPAAASAAVEWKAVKELRSQVAALHDAVESLPEEASWSTMVQRSTEIMRRFVSTDGALEVMEGKLARLGGLDEVTSPVRLEQFVDVLRRAIDTWTIRRPEDGTFQKSGIFIGDVMDARLLSFHTVALVGLVEKSFPVLPRQDPILLDDEREEIGAVIGPERLPLKTRRLEEERLLFRLARSCAAESILISYPRLDPATARPRNPSPFLLRIAAELEGERFDYRALDDLPRMRRVSLSSLAPDDSAAALLPREFDLAVIHRALGEGSNADMRGRVVSLLRGNHLLARALEAENARWGEPRFNAYDGVILRPNVLDALRQAHAAEGAPVSASRIEEYATCPLAYFMRRVLGLQPLEDPEEAESIDAMRRGGIVHRILFETFTSLSGSGALPLTRETLPAALAALDEACDRRFAEEENQGVIGYPLLWAIDKERIREDLAEALRIEATEDTSYRPSRYEIRYGMPGRGDEEDPASTDEPMVFEIQPGRTVKLKGRIDRIDVTADGASARITDYKTGRMKKYGADRLGGGTSVQLPLYMIAAEKLLAPLHPGVRAEEARYLSVDRKGGFRSVGFSSGALATRREELARVLATFLNGVARGVFFAYPDTDACRWCDYKLACGEGREARFARKRNDATAADFLRMREEIA